MRLIDADALQVEIWNELARLKGAPCTPHDAAVYMADMVDEAPTIEAEPVRQGRWIPYDADCIGFAAQFLCTVCKTYSYTHTYQKGCDFEYCPNCGAKMDGGADNA